VLTIAIDKLVENPETKKIYGPGDDSTLKLSISLLGILEPLVVFKIGDSDQYQIVSGNRRWSVAKELSLSEVPVSVIEPKDINEVLSIGHNEYRKKLPSHYIREYRAYNALHNLTQGKKSEASKKAIELRNQLFNNIAKSTLDRYLRVDKIAKEIAGGDEIVYNELLVELDLSSNADGTRKSFLKRLQEKNNRELIPDFYEFHSPEAVIYNKSSEDLSEISNNSVSVIVTSPPYFFLRDYENGPEQLGHEENEDLFVQHLVQHFEDCKRVLKQGGTMWVNLGDFVVDFAYRMVPEKFTIQMMKSGWLLHDKIIWLKNNPMWTGSNRSVVTHEYIYVFKLTDFVNYSFEWLFEQDINDRRYIIGAGSEKVKLRSIFDFRDGVVTTNSANNFRLKEYCEKAGIHLTHSATFPISIPTIAIFTSTEELDLVLDPFNGTATTGRSALLFRRRYVGYDLNPTYIKQSEIRLNMPTVLDIEELGVKIESKLINSGIEVQSRSEAKKLKNRMIKVDFENNINQLIEEGFTILSSFPYQYN
jgi:site-specific DNA-methyltransferase (adenine-specific)